MRALVGAALIAGTGFAGYRVSKGYEPPYDYGNRARKIDRLEAELMKEPCDRSKTEELLEHTLSAGDNRGVLRRADAFWAKCGEFVQLRMYTYRAHAQLTEWDGAVADVTRLVESEPYSPYYRAWRGIVYQDKGDLERAVADFREALLLRPQLSDIPLNLAATYEKLGRPCDAAFPLQQLVFHYPTESWSAGIRERIADLEKRGGCGVVASGAGRATISMEPGRTAIRVKVHLDDKETAVFLLDTGASYVTLTRVLAGKLGLELGAAPEVRLQTANGEKKGKFVSLRSVAVEGLAAKSVPAVVVDDVGPGIDGLLGLSFLARFEMRQANGVVELTVKGAGPR